MADTRNLKKLFKKLSALRATLTDEEQILLDSLTVGHYLLVAHRFAAGYQAVRLPTPFLEAEGVAHVYAAEPGAHPPVHVSFHPERECYVVS